MFLFLETNGTDLGQTHESSGHPGAFPIWLFCKGEFSWEDNRDEKKNCNNTYNHRGTWMILQMPTPAGANFSNMFRAPLSSKWPKLPKPICKFPDVATLIIWTFNNQTIQKYSSKAYNCSWLPYSLPKNHNLPRTSAHSRTQAPTACR